MKILALDLGKFNTMCCYFDTETRKNEFINASTERNYLTTVFKKYAASLIVMEACGPSGWIHDLCVPQSSNAAPRKGSAPKKKKVLLADRSPPKTGRAASKRNAVST